mgnify:CR=1 FL=1
MKIFILIFTILFLSACTPTHKNKTNTFVLPEELADCKIFSLSNTNGTTIFVTRCPNSTTNTSTVGKHSQHVTVAEY